MKFRTGNVSALHRLLIGYCSEAVGTVFVYLFVGSMADGRTLSLYWVLEKHSHILEGWCVNRATDEDRVPGGWPMK